MANRMLFYGVTGYTGRLVAEAAVKQGLNPIVSARRAEATQAIATELGTEARPFSLDDAATMDRALEDVAVVLNLAGPFSRTGVPLAQACIRTGTHYLDIAGEVPEFEAIKELDQAAQEAGVMLMPGVGFGIVPTECLAALLHRALPDASHLAIAFFTEGGVSRGTLGVVLKDIHRPGVARRDGSFEEAHPAEKIRQIEFSRGTRTAVLNPWRADLSTAAVSTAIPNIESYSVFPTPVRWLMSKWSGILLNRGFVQSGLQALLRRLPDGPSAEERAAGHTELWGEVRNAERTITATLEGPEAYDFTALTALNIVARAAKGDAKPGFQTPSQGYGPDLVFEIDGVRWVKEPG